MSRRLVIRRRPVEHRPRPPLRRTRERDASVRADRARRGATFLWLLLYLVGAGLAPVVDARLGAAAETVTHVEAPTEKPCAPAHDHLVCPVCRTIQFGGAGDAASARLATGPGADVRLPAPALAAHPDPVLALLPDSRAPPPEAVRPDPRSQGATARRPPPPSDGGAEPAPRHASESVEERASCCATSATTSACSS